MTRPLYKIIFTLAFSLSCFFAGAQPIAKWKLADLQSAMDSTDKPTVFTFWATFCKPCLAEIPYFQEIIRSRKDSIRLVLVSVDMAEMYPDKIRTVAKRFKMQAPLSWLDETNADIFCPVVDPSWSGSIPATLFVNNRSGYRYFFEGEMTREEFQKEINRLVNVIHKP